MGRRPRPLPGALGDAFTTEQALAHGVTRKQLERLPAPYRGVRCRTEPGSIGELCAAARLALPVGAAFAGPTAAELHGLWLPRRWEPGDELHVVVPSGTARSRVAGIRCGWDDADVVDRDGLAVSAPADVLAQLAPALGLVDLVVLADSLVSVGTGRDVAELTAALRRGRRGAARARRALRLARAGSGSAQETRTRLWLLDAGLPEPELNGMIVLDDRTCYGDLVWRDARVVVEYHGAYHFESPEQRLADFERLAALRAAGWMVVEIGRGTLTNRRRRDAFVDTVAAALGVRARPPHRRGRLLGAVRRRRKRPSAQ